MKKIKIALIGYGNRGRLYSSFIKDNLDKIDYVAIIDYRANEIANDIKNNTSAKYIFSSDDEFFKAVSLEIVHARIASKEPEYRRNLYEKKSSAIAYMLQQKYGLEEKNVTLQIPEELSEKNGRDIKKELFGMRTLFTEINEELKLAIKKEQDIKVSERDGHEER